MKNPHFSSAERDLVFNLAHKLTGTLETEGTRHEIVMTNVHRRMMETGKQTLMAYLELVSKNPVELGHFVSAVTIHTTSWFREMPHYRELERELLASGSKLATKKFRLMSAACSTGEELYSFGLILETFRRQVPGFDYELVGFDVDPVSVAKAENGFYHIDDISFIPQNYRSHLMSRSKRGEKNYLIDPEIRRRAKFSVMSLLEGDKIERLEKFDQVVCRNVLIYFTEQKIDRSIQNLMAALKLEGTLTLGHSETIDSRKYGLVSLGKSSYRRPEEKATLSTDPSRPIHVLAIDDSSWIRSWLTNVLQESGFKVTTAEGARHATQIIETQSFDMITLDLNMPDQHGLSWLTEQRHKGLRTPVILVTDVDARQAPEVLDALAGNAQDYVNKALLGVNSSELGERINTIVKAHRHKDESLQKPATFAEFKSKPSFDLERPDLIVLGASTGGTDALCQVLESMPSNCPPIVVVQHIPREFSQAFLDRLANAARLKAETPERGKEILPGHIYMPVQDAHIGVRLSGEKLLVYDSHSDKICGHRPSVDFLFQSASLLRGKKVFAGLLTGMGRDGAQGLLELRRMGAMTAAQDQLSSTVWGMPGEAVKIGAAQLVGNIRELREVLIQAISKPTATAKRVVPPIRKIG